MTRPSHQMPRISPALDGFRIDINQNELRADIILDRPPFNLVSSMQWEQLRAAFEVLDDDPRVRVIVVRAQGEHFCSGNVIDETASASPEYISRFAWNMEAPSRCSKPVIAANRGYCFGAGFELSLACDFRIATETTMYALSAQNAGQLPGADASARLQKLVGVGRTKDIVMRARHIRGAQAYEWGIATEFVVDSDLEMLTETMVRELVAVPPNAQRKAKRLLNAIEDIALSGPTEDVGRGQPPYLKDTADTRRTALIEGK
ncbi:enoyl-CoA hydratase/isomerase family protein [Burkholderia sp. Ac-20365]|uniref:enoyl-CoA hydratase/isomerase family protein n=1 Tax=Burkholderia sp. Ac-20365 TaxID=2703897 RepID=UPI00197B6C53|nr:enoyl-CoA hydratase/isomerase family protein [Burkholderia sp. Ac-20365]MBN3761557.1 enoyl-CoA hydratase/isomerase family protein [Burkholderia sp. Ac-20365]